MDLTGMILIAVGATAIWGVRRLKSPGSRLPIEDLRVEIEVLDVPSATDVEQGSGDQDEWHSDDKSGECAA